MHPYKWDGRCWHYDGRKPAPRETKRSSALRSVKEVRATLARKGLVLENLSDDELAGLGRLMEAASRKLRRLTNEQDGTDA